MDGTLRAVNTTAPENSAGALAAKLNAALPQTQCTRCGYPDCAAYAEAIAQKSAPINQCPPGGDEGISRLAALTGRPALPLNPDHGLEAPRQMAVIDEAWCIGCTLCLKACPVDAIVGGPKRMHTVIETHCTGCELCVPVCPVDCISLENTSGTLTGWAAWSDGQARDALARYAFHQSRLQREQAEHDARLAVRAKPVRPARTPANTAPDAEAAPPAGASPDAKRAAIDAALARARAARQPKAS